MSSVLLAVGDASGDAYAADFAAALRARRPRLRLFGLGGAEMERVGVELVAHQRDLAVGGLFELAPDLHRVARTWWRLAAALSRERPDLVVLVDSAGFNLPFARRVRRAGIPSLYFVCPQVWAWRRGRIRKLARRVDRLAVIHPFEPAVYAGSGARVEYVGHPLVDRLARAARASERAGARAALGVPPGARLVVLLPGSRRDELRHCLPVHLETARALHARDPELRFALPIAPSLERGWVAARVRRARLPARLQLELLDGRSVAALCACDAALAKPGTATLEAALIGRPLVVAARSTALSAALLRRLLRIDWLALPNLLAGARIVPEFLQEEAVPERIAAALWERLAGPAREEQLRAFARVREVLGAGGAAERAARIAEEMLVAAGGT